MNEGLFMSLSMMRQAIHVLHDAASKNNRRARSRDENFEPPRKLK